ncbi:resolvase : Resolvase domain protein OS=Isosphaera pallida (strain ATCC 43644 / DSM 9630 / IS1B) GN=Isop_2455 PE=4 SV=1: Resolvase: Recombinase [Gemmata massiliana]|uniref:Resolvase/invertase-type recombinase catalytic domain-containing protein n=1 Tax=Gemmata massiliana TaxID=1210884 RepID=A0A6P2CTI2_9BACT|nr:recombinase family protein [Gemmata massiliana]VTR92458.1 resolvase : Resolvase domain protein OS=Isosphaera pallida (strain ATCC 43644 / DSM 9630 / IS1B) GN=Isop_2455 PE=4 SV=1: Resolvase: Recombinase [Gemmata massiliana]
MTSHTNRLNRHQPKPKPADREPTPVVRCAIYTRKSTEEGLEQEFNSLDAQREAGEAFIRSQAGEGWVVLGERYDDGGFAGANTDRPGLHTLLADIADGKVDCVVVYKVDRLSRSLLDFAQMMNTFEHHHVAFVSVTQQFNTASSMGRLVLNVLLSFAQFEREIISERTGDKTAATRRKGTWAGAPGPRVRHRPGRVQTCSQPRRGRARAPDLRPVPRARGSAPGGRGTRAAPVDHQALGHAQGDGTRGKPFDRTSVCNLLTNPLYIGHVRYKDEVHQGEHPAIVEAGVFTAVQHALARNGAPAGRWCGTDSGRCSKGYCGAGRAGPP